MVDRLERKRLEANQARLQQQQEEQAVPPAFDARGNERCFAQYQLDFTCFFAAPQFGLLPSFQLHLPRSSCQKSIKSTTLAAQFLRYLDRRLGPRLCRRFHTYWDRLK